MTSNEHKIGGQALLGFQYQLFPRLLIGTEAFYRLSGSAEKVEL